MASEKGKEAKKRQNVKYGKSSPGAARRKEAINKYHTSTHGKEAKAAAQKKYSGSPHGKEAKAAAEAKYSAGLQGKAAHAAAFKKYSGSPHGKKAKAAAEAKYSAGLQGKEAHAAAFKKYSGSPHGKEAKAAAQTKYSGSPHGKSATNEATKTYREKPEFLLKKKQYENANKERLSQSRKQRYRKKHSFAKSGDDSDDELEFNIKRKEAMEKIKKHVVQHGKKMKFLEGKKVILGFRKSVYLPKIQSTSHSGMFKTKSFMKSKSKLQWKTAAIKIFKDNLSEEMTTRIIKNRYSRLNFKRKTIQYQKLFVANQLQKRVMNLRDLWIKVLYGRCHQLAINAERLIDEEKLDTTEEKYFDRFLGWKSHRKGYEPHFPLHSFWNGEHFHFKYSKKDKKSREEVRKTEKCTANCIPATLSEVSQFRDLMHDWKDLEARQSRMFVQGADDCGNLKGDAMYKLLIDKRNHPESCYRAEEKNKCTSSLVLLRKLAVHYGNVRSIYKIVNDMKVADQFVSDIDTATAIGDIEYLLKLLEYKPLISVKTFDVERPSEIVNEDFMMEKFKEHYLKYLHTISLNPEVKCISCKRLFVDDPEKCKTITSRWKKISQPNSEYSKLLQFLQSHEWMRKGAGRTRQETLVGERLCAYCYNKMQKGEIPRVSIRNNMDEGVQPDVIKDLTPFERMFIRQVSMFQTFLKLGPSVGNRPNNEKMSAVKGFSVHIPVPVEMTVRQLAGEKTGLINPRSFIVLHGIPTKDKRVWQSLINVEKIIAALKWLVKNNPLYKDIKVPTESEILDMLCEVDTDNEDGNISSVPTNFFDSPDPPTSSDDFSSDAASPQQQPKRPRSTFTATSDDIGISSPGTMPDFYEREPRSADDNYLEQLCQTDSNDDGSLDQNESSSFSSNTSLPWRRRKTTIPGISDIDMTSDFEDMSCNSEENEPFATDKGGDQPSESLLRESRTDIDCMELGVQQEDLSFPGLWKFSATVSEEEMVRLKNMSSANSRRKNIAIRCVIHMARMLQSNGSVCKRCFEDVRNSRELMVRLLREGSDTLGYQLLDIKALMSAFGKIRAALLCEENSILSNKCSFCDDYKISNRPFHQKARRTYQGNVKKIILNSHERRADWSTKFFYHTRVKTLAIIDEMKQKVQLCDGCSDEMETSCCKAISHFAKPSRSLTMKIRKRATALHDVYCESQGLAAKAKLTEHYPKNGLIKHGMCAKCDNVIPINGDFLDVKFEDVELPQMHVDQLELSKEVEVISVRNTKSTKLLSEVSLVQQKMSEEDKSNNRSENQVYCQHILHNIYTALKKSLHCKECKKKISATALAFEHLAKHKNPTRKSQPINLEQCDTIALKSLNIYYSERLSSSIVLDQCFKCDKVLDLTGGGDSNDDSYSDLDFNSTPESETDDDGESDLEQANHAGSDTKDAPAAATSDEGGSTDEDSPKTKDPRTMIEEMTPDDYKNLIEDFTVTGMDILDENPELMEDLYKLLRLDGDPIEMSDSNLDLLAFPEIFCWGTGGRKGFRGEEAKPLQYEKSRLLSSNGPTRRNVQHLFHLAGDCERRKIRSSIFATLKNVQDLGNLDAATLLQKIKTKDPALLRRINKVLRLVPNTQAYWESQRAKLKAQIEKFGPPTFFATFSPAEYDWEDLMQHIKDVNKDIPNIDELSPSALLNKDPVMTSIYIHKRFDALLKFIIDAEPLGKVKSYFVRHEYQTRGTIHFHTFFWIEGAPIIGKNSDAEIASFVQKHITCRLPDKIQEASLLDVVESYQMHKCRPYCLRRFKKSKNASKVKKGSLTNGLSTKVACRFGFPRPKSKKFVLHEVLSCVIGRRKKQMRRRLYDLPRHEDERRINDYNPILSFLWKGNMDIQFLAEDSHSITEYVTKYITKGESSSIDLNDADLRDLTKTSYQNLSKIAFQLLKSREMGAHEAADRILHNNGELWRSSETFVWVPTTTPDRRTRVMRNMKELEAQKPDSKNVFYDDWVHTFYPNRPRTKEFEDMTLHDFVSSYEKVIGKPKNEDSQKYIRIASEDGLYIRTLQKRKKSPVIYHHNYSLKTDPELFYYSLLFLYKPWRRESDLSGQHESYSKAFFDAVEIYSQLREMAEKKINIEKAREKMEKDAEAKMAESDDEDDDQSYEMAGNAQRSGLDDFEASNDKSEIRSREDLDSFVQTLNNDQKRVYDKVTQHIERMLSQKEGQGTTKADDSNEPLFLYVSGFGGTGKSYLIKALQGFLWVMKNICDKPADIALTAPTGLAAANIDGLTLHSLFNLPVEHGELQPKYKALKQNSVQQTRTVLKDLALLVIDEISMVSAQLLMLVNLRMQEIFGPKELFGGKCVIVFGDLLQLPPVHGKRPFEELNGDDVHTLTGGLRIPCHLWENFQFDELTINQRQKGQENERWSAILGRIRIGRQTQEDIQTLEERLIPLKDCDLPKEYLEQIVQYYLELQKKHTSTVCLLPKRNMMDAFNAEVMRILFPEAIEVTAEDEVDGKTKSDRKRATEAVIKIDKLGDSRNTADLEKRLLLCKGVRVMLRKNIDTARGLVNGAMGTVEEIVRVGKSEDPKDPAECLHVRFDGVEGIVRIPRETRKIKLFEQSFLHRRQFPVSVGYALTIHKSQGMSLSHVFCDLGNSVFATGQVYVALSRCRTIQGLYLVNFNASKIKVDALAISEYVRLKSKPIRDAGISSMADTQAGAERKRKRGQKGSERVWYGTETAKKAKSTAKENINNTADCGKSKKNTKSKRPAASNPGLTANSVDRFINRIHENVPAEHIPTTDIVNERDVQTVYRRVLVPCNRSANENGFFLNGAALELDPDPFGQRQQRSLWLSGSTIMKYLAVLKDHLAECGGPTVYNMGPYCGTFNPTRRYNKSMVRDFTENTFRERPFTKLV